MEGPDATDGALVQLSKASPSADTGWTRLLKIVGNETHQIRLSIKTEMCPNQRFIAGNFAKSSWQSSRKTLVGESIPAFFSAAEPNPGVINPLGSLFFRAGFFFSFQTAGTRCQRHWTDSLGSGSGFELLEVLLHWAKIYAHQSQEASHLLIFLCVWGRKETSDRIKGVFNPMSRLLIPCPHSRWPLKEHMYNLTFFIYIQ